jgi:hypothetical protein
VGLGPQVDPFPEGDLPVVGVEVGVAALVGFDIGGARLRRGLGGVAAVGGDAAVGQPVAHPEQGAAFFDPGHAGFLSR